MHNVEMVQVRMCDRKGDILFALKGSCRVMLRMLIIAARVQDEMRGCGECLD
jgi:hypothetical protein